MKLGVKILNRLNISKPQRKFLITLFTTILVARGKINFRNLSRYSDPCEHTYSRHFAKAFDFISFNRQVIDETFSYPDEEARILALDASFIPKSGSHTFGRDHFWNGCASRSEKGLELSALSVVSLPLNQALTLSVQQTRAYEDDEKAQDVEETRINQYLSHVQAVHPYLAKNEHYLAVDGALAKAKFVTGVTALDLHIIGKLRCDANMRYLYEGPKRKGRGRPKTYDGKVDWHDLSRFTYVGRECNITLYTAVLNHITFKCNLRVVVLVKHALGATPTYAILFATDINLDPKKIFQYYKARFQIEFLFRDAKQFTGLTDCQARDQNRLHFHFNASLTTLNLAKAELLEKKGTHRPIVCSMASVKALYFNQHFLKRIFRILNFDLTSIKNQDAYHNLLHYGRIAA